MSNFHRNRKGFTLIEILTVIAIIGILGAIATVSTTAILNEKKKDSVKTSLVTYWKYTNQYFQRINAGMTSSGPQATELGAMLNLRVSTSPDLLTLSTASCKSLKEGCIYVQYKYNAKSVNNRYTIVRIIKRYDNMYYYTTDGKDLADEPSTKLPS